MIAIKSNKEILFTGGTGIVTITIDVPIIRPNQSVYELRLVDSCVKQTIVEGKPTYKKVGQDIIRFRPYSYEQLQALIDDIDYDITKNNLVLDIEELFRIGLLKITQQECLNGISGIEGKGMYYSEAQDWEIVR